MERGWMEHTMFKPEPYSEREAWVWIIEHAAWKPSRVSINGEWVAVERGQIATAERYLAEAWGWSKTSVHRFLGKIRGVSKSGPQKEPMIETHSGPHHTLITICNYAKYQDQSQSVGPQKEPDIEPQSGPEKDHRRTKEEQDIQDRSESSSAREVKIHSRYAEVRERVEAILNSPSCTNMNRIAAWLEAGAIPETDIYPILEARMVGWHGTTLKYFDRAIADAIASRTSPMPPGQAPPGKFDVDSFLQTAKRATA